MSAVVKDGSLCTGHGCFPPRTNLSSSSKFFIEGRGVVRVGDVWAPHCCKTCHIGIQATGSKKMFVEGRPVARMGDFISCGSKNLTGSFRMFSEG
jgi:uncharacterized Zn-binding protein involved in type VI secretion